MKFLLSSGSFWALLSAVFATLTAILAKVGVEAVDPDLATFLRTLVVTVALATLLALTRGWEGVGAIPPRAAGFLVLSGLATGASRLCYFRALKLGDAARLAPLDKLSVVLVAVFRVVFLGETLGPVSWLGVGLIGAGAALVALGA